MLNGLRRESCGIDTSDHLVHTTYSYLGILKQVGSTGVALSTLVRIFQPCLYPDLPAVIIDNRDPYLRGCDLGKKPST